jgi:hypothetical protein
MDFLEYEPFKKKPVGGRNLNRLSDMRKINVWETTLFSEYHLQLFYQILFY